MKSATQLDLRVHHDGSRATVIEVAGEIDLTSVARLREALKTAVARGTVVLDTANVIFCDSSGLRALIEAGQAARAHGTRFRLAACSAAVYRVIDLTGMLGFFETFPDVETALEG